MPDALDGGRPGRLAGLPRRIYLTYRYRGIRAVVYRSLIFPLRLTPLDRVLPLGGGSWRAVAQARRWYRAHGRPVTIVIPSFRDAALVAQLVAKIRQTTARKRVRIIVTDDAGGDEHVAALRAIGGIEVLAAADNGGFAVNANRGLRAADPRHDVVLLNSDVVPRRGWLECLQNATSSDREVGIVGAKLLYPDNRIQYGGTIRNPRAPEWFDHRYRGKPADWGPADVAGPTLAATGACMYLTRRALDRVGRFDEDYGMGYEDVDYCLRAWEAGFQVIYAPSAALYHHESVTRGTEVGERERRSQRVFWKRWSAFFDERPVLTADGRLRVVYVTQDTIVGGGHRDVFEHLNGLAARGHDVQLWTLGREPDWFALRCPVRRFADYAQLESALAPLPAIKVATWWNTATTVWRASVVNGLPVYFVQDIETSYYPDDPERRYEVLNSYRPEFRFLTISSWNEERLRELGLDATLVPPGIDRETFRPLPGTIRRDDLLVALGRSDPLKNLPLTLDAWRRLPQPRPELCLFGRSPELATGPGVRYVRAPSDEQVGVLLNQATVFLQTSTHEGFCLPILEAMATGAAVVCTDAHGNRDFCIDGENCLMPEPTPAAVAAAVTRLLADPALRARLGQAGVATAARYRWPERIDALERFMLEIAQPRRTEPSTDKVPGPRRR
ncbi:MAG: glycosyltransferase [Solirubrobacteraceae bacterium]|jgi:GT2 family glycosyltransferase